MTRFLTLILALSSLTVQASNWFVTPSGSGSHNGSTWQQAFAGIPATLVRGDTYYIASGVYGFATFTQPASGTTPVYFRKATAGNHGTDTGWQAGYGTGQAIFANNTGSCWDIRTSYLDFEGVTGTLTNSDYGFKLVSGYTGSVDQGCVQVFNPFTSAGVSIRHVQMVGSGQNVTGQERSDGIFNASTIFGWTVQNCFMDNFQSWIVMSYCNTIVIDHNYFRNAGSSSGVHDAGISGAMTNVVISYNVFENMLGPSCTTYIEPQGNAGSNLPTLIPGNWRIYGNVYRATSPSERTTQWANFSVTSNNYMYDFLFYNNTSYGLNGPVGISGGNIPGSTGFIVENNVWVNCPTSGGFPNTQQTDHNAYSGGAPIGDLVWTGSFVDAANGNFRLSQNSVSGATLPAPYNLDPDGNSRIPGAWSIGAYQFNPIGSPGQLSLNVNSDSVQENGGSISVTASRTGGSSGVVGLSYTTTDGDAVAGVNYTTTSGTLSWANGDLASKSFTVPIINAGFVGSKTFTATISTPTGGATIIGNPVETISIVGVGVPSCPTMAGWSFDASAGLISVPLYVTNTTDIWQPVDTQGYPQTSGKACYVVTITNAGQYTLQGIVNPTAANGNSCYIDFDTTPSDPTTIWDVYPVGVGFITNAVGWRGTGTVDLAQYPVKVWQLSAGTHTLNILGREANFIMRKWTLIPLQTNATPVLVSCLSAYSPTAWYRAGQTVPITVAFSTNAFVTGTPLLALNNGVNATYIGGSGSSNLVFSWPVVPGHDTTQLDYATTNSLSGTIKGGDGSSAVLTLPVRGAPGSISYSSTVGIDTLVPTITIGSPSVTKQWIMWPVTYADTGTNFLSSSLSVANVHLVSTGTAAAGIFIAGTGSGAYQAVLVGGLSGIGTLSISIDPGTGMDWAGNMAGGAVSGSAAVGLPNVILNNVKLYNVLFP